MSEKPVGMPANADDRRSVSAGVATEITAKEPLTAEQAAAFRIWLKEKLGADSETLSRVAMHGGLAASDLSRLLDEPGSYLLNRDQMQRIATSLVEMGMIPHADEAWAAAGLGGSDYIVSPSQVVQAMSRGV